MNIYIGNLAWKTKRKELKELFENFGEVTNAFIVRDKKTRRSRGFGFVEMVEDDDAKMAIEKLNNTVFLERTIIVNEARPKEEGDDDTSYQDDSDQENDSGEEDNSEEKSRVDKAETPDEEESPGDETGSAIKKNDGYKESDDTDADDEPSGGQIEEDSVRNS